MRLICDLTPHVSDAVSLGTSSLMFSDLFVASGSVINFNNGDVLLTHSSNALTVSGGQLSIHKDSIDGLKISRTSGASENIHIGVQSGANLTSTTFPGIIKFHGTNQGEIYTQGSQPLVLGTNATARLTIAGGGGATFAGTIASGAITSTGKITGTELEGTSLDINGAADISGALTGVDALTMSGILDITGTTDSSNATGDTGILRCEGGASIAKKLYVGSTITGSADVIAFSDRKLKDNIETLDGKKVLDMRGVSFTRKDTGLPSSGVIAQEIQKVAPELVHDTEGTLGVAYGNLVGYLIEAVKDQQKQIDELKAMCNGCSK